jgi:hypothetical protein
LPPVDAGGVKLTVAPVVLMLAVTPVGESGRPTGVTGADGADAGPGPDPLAAVTVKV